MLTVFLFYTYVHVCMCICISSFIHSDESFEEDEQTERMNGTPLMCYSSKPWYNHISLRSTFPYSECQWATPYFISISMECMSVLCMERNLQVSMNFDKENGILQLVE